MFTNSSKNAYISLLDYEKSNVLALVFLTKISVIVIYAN